MSLSVGTTAVVHRSVGGLGLHTQSCSLPEFYSREGFTSHPGEERVPALLLGLLAWFAAFKVRVKHGHLAVPGVSH